MRMSSCMATVISQLCVLMSIHVMEMRVAMSWICSQLFVALDFGI